MDAVKSTASRTADIFSADKRGHRCRFLRKSNKRD